MKMENTTSMNNAIVSGGTMREAELRKDSAPGNHRVQLL